MINATIYTVFIASGIVGVVVATLINLYILTNKVYQIIFKIVMVFVTCGILYIGLRYEFQKIFLFIFFGFSFGLASGFDKTFFKRK